MAAIKQKITPFLWFDKNAEEAMNFYTSVFKNSRIVSIKRYPEGPLEEPMKGMEGKVLTAVFELMKAMLKMKKIDIETLKQAYKRR